MHRTRHAFFSMALAAIAALFVFGATDVLAQGPPPCGAADLIIKNGTNCDLDFWLKGDGGAFNWPVAANDVTVVTLPLGFVPLGVVNTGNNTTYEFITPSPDPSAPWWVPNITISGCCVDVFYDPANCVMWVLDTSSPPPCQ